MAMRRVFERVRIPWSLLVALCASICVLMPTASAGAEFEPGGLPDECTFEEGELGHYIVVFYDWVEDPEAVAREQVERYGGNLGFVYRYALKGYSAEFPPESVRALQEEPTVNRVDVDHLIWMDEASGIIQWRSCPLAPPLDSEPLPGPEPPVGPDLPEEPELPDEPAEPEQPEEPDDLEPSVEPPPEPSSPNGEVAEPTDTTQLQDGTGGLQAEGAEPRVKRCGKGRARKGNRCVRRRGRLDSACKKRKIAGKLRCSRDT